MTPNRCRLLHGSGWQKSDCPRDSQVSSIHAILIDILGMSKLYEEWVPQNWSTLYLFLVWLNSTGDWWLRMRYGITTLNLTQSKQWEIWFPAGDRLFGNGWNYQWSILRLRIAKVKESAKIKCRWTLRAGVWLLFNKSTGMYTILGVIMKLSMLKRSIGGPGWIHLCSVKRYTLVVLVYWS